MTIFLWIVGIVGALAGLFLWLLLRGARGWNRGGQS